MSFVGPAAPALAAGGRPNPPGASPGPGAPMPNYQGVPGASWNGAARGVPNAPTPPTISTQVNFQSNTKIVSAHVSRPWSNGQGALVREGHLGFVARTGKIAATEEVSVNQVTSATLQHLQAIASEGYTRARMRLESGNLPSGIRITAQEFDTLNEADICDYLGSEEREKTVSPEDPVMAAALKLLHIDEFKYLLPTSKLMHWNFYGPVNNISIGTSLETQINRNLPRALIVNYAVAKDCFVSNIWGDSLKVSEGCSIGLIVRRRGGKNPGTLGCPEIVPWSDRDLDTPPLSDRCYYDSMGRIQWGYYIPIGHVTEVGTRDPNNRKRIDAIGAGGKPANVVHDAYGTLPKIRIVVGV